MPREHTPGQRIDHGDKIIESQGKSPGSDRKTT